MSGTCLTPPVVSTYALLLWVRPANRPSAMAPMPSQTSSGSPSRRRRTLRCTHVDMLRGHAGHAGSQTGMHAFSKVWGIRGYEKRGRHLRAWCVSLIFSWNVVPTLSSFSRLGGTKKRGGRLGDGLCLSCNPSER